MKNNKWFFLLLLFGLIFSGCEENQCVKCDDCPSGVSLESELVCEQDFSSTAAWEQARELAESYGCTCK